MSVGKLSCAGSTKYAIKQQLHFTFNFCYLASLISMTPALIFPCFCLVFRVDGSGLESQQAISYIKCRGSEVTVQDCDVKRNGTCAMGQRAGVICLGKSLSQALVCSLTESSEICKWNLLLAQTIGSQYPFCNQFSSVIPRCTNETYKGA